VGYVLGCLRGKLCGFGAWEHAEEELLPWHIVTNRLGRGIMAGLGKGLVKWFSPLLRKRC